MSKGLTGTAGAHLELKQREQQPPVLAKPGKPKASKCPLSCNILKLAFKKVTDTHPTKMSLPLSSQLVKSIKDKLVNLINKVEDYTAICVGYHGDSPQLSESKDIWLTY